MSAEPSNGHGHLWSRIWTRFQDLVTVGPPPYSGPVTPEDDMSRSPKQVLAESGITVQQVLESRKGRRDKESDE